MRLHSRKVSFLGLVAIVLLSQESWADTVALQIGSFTTERKQFSETMGWSFTANEPITVTQLGVFDPDLDGFVDPHQVGLWTEAGSLLVDTTAPAGTGATPDGFFRYVPVTPTTLTAGENYVIGAHFLDGSDDLREGIVSSFGTVPEIEYLDQRKLGFGETLRFPSGAFSGGPTLGPNFQFVSEPVGDVFWSTISGPEGSVIQRANSDGSNIRTIINSPVSGRFGGIAIDDANRHIYSGDGSYLFRTDLDGSNRVNLVPNTSLTDVELDLQHGRVYWGDSSVPRGIFSATLDGSDVRTVRALRAFDLVEGIALDPESNKLYYAFNTSPYDSQIRVSNLDGSGDTSLFDIGALEGQPFQPFEVEIDIASDKIYWNYPGGGIRQANQDGTDLQWVPMGGQTTQNGIDFDPRRDDVYFIATGGSIYRSALDGSDPEFVLNSGVGNYVYVGLPMIGDMDRDGDVDFDDIDAFVLGLNAPAAYENIFGVPPSQRGDTDGDGDHDFDDIPGFVDLLNAGGRQQAVPEPPSIMLALVALAAITGCLRHNVR